MSEIKFQPVPMARTEEILVESLEDEVLIYDLRSHEAICLNASAVVIWDLCDGQRTIGDIVDEVGNAEVTERHVADTLDQLREKNLLEVDATTAAHRAGAPTSRRAFLGTAAAASVVLPAVMSAMVPTAAAALPIFSTCSGTGSTGNPQCNAGNDPPTNFFCCQYNTPSVPMGDPKIQCCVDNNCSGSTAPAGCYD
jgi:hypothetical protein